MAFGGTTRGGKIEVAVGTVVFVGIGVLVGIGVSEGVSVNVGDGVSEGVSVKVGDRILYSKYSGSEIKLGGTEYLIISEKDVLAIVDERVPAGAKN